MPGQYDDTHLALSVRISRPYAAQECSMAALVVACGANVGSEFAEDSKSGRHVFLPVSHYRAAWARSSIKSSWCSTPTESLNKASVIPKPARSAAGSFA